VLAALAAASLLRAADMPVTFDEVLALESRPPSRTLRYGKAPSNTGALWLAAAQGPRPVVVLVHGGCWLQEYAAPHIYPLASRLASDGYAVFVPEYRRVGEPGGGWPGSASDLVRALDALAALDHPRLDLDRTVLAGHSAGGQLALWLASRDPALARPPLRIVAAVGLAAITDLPAYAAGDNSCEVVTPRFLGGTLQERPDVYAAASPSSLSFAVPVALLAGEEDPIVGREQAEGLTGVVPRWLPGGGHFDWIHPGTAAYPALRDLLFELLSASVEGGTP
jgi:acetyl esterase/lipase